MDEHSIAAAAAGNASGNAAGNGAAAAAPAEKTTLPGKSAADSGRRPGDTGSAAAGRTAAEATADAAVPPSAPDTRRADFERLISGEYKDLFTERVTGIINRRFGEDKRASEELERLTAERERGEESRRLSEAAGRLGRSLRASDEAEAIYASWLGEAEELKAAYPDFDLKAAVGDPAVGRLLKAGVPLRNAYEAVNLDAVRSGIEAEAARAAEARTLDGVRLRGVRPAENGASPGSAVLTGGVNSLSRAERAELAKKAMRGLL